MLYVLIGLGPNAKTVSDFIQMIWDQRPPVLVMLTRLVEKGKVHIQFCFFWHPCSYHLQNFVEKFNEQDSLVYACFIYICVDINCEQS